MDVMATPLTTDQSSPEQILAVAHCGGGGGTSITAAGASPRWSGPDPDLGRTTGLPAPSAPGCRPTLTFPVGGHECHQYQIESGFYECVHGHVRRVEIRVLPGSR
ncbi:hypothetical protein CF165_46550 [Amycolatopsis vastitatis]|uniref:Uncharacterized protein n=1 Tax=Amycolatopsis vastitatis TaxID=1905142 RepID=A0A229SLK1_9PSEU|nr:hypothetical protein CF165_46550 [Amycolatopsis vastitatis]